MRHAPFHHLHRRDHARPHNSSAMTWRSSTAASTSANPRWGETEYARERISRRALPASRSRSVRAPSRREQRPPSAAGSAKRSRDARRSSAPARTCQLVAYDQGNGAYAARLWWLARWIGLRNVAVLDGGIAAWRAAGLPLETRGTHAASRASCRCRSPTMPGVEQRRRSTSCASGRATCSSTPAARIVLPGATRPSTRSPVTCPARATGLSPAISAPTEDSCPPSCCAQRLDTLLGSLPPARAHRHVRLGRHRLPQSARARTRGPAAARVCMPVPGASGSAIRGARSPRVRTRSNSVRHSWRLLARPICYRARQRGSRSQPDSRQHQRKAGSRAAPNDPSPGRSKIPQSSTRSTPGARVTSA